MLSACSAAGLACSDSAAAHHNHKKTITPSDYPRRQAGFTLCQFDHSRAPRGNALAGHFASMHRFLSRHNDAKGHRLSAHAKRGHYSQKMQSREEAIFHLVNHSTYHRGAIGHALDRADGNRPADTYTVFIHGAEPERRNV